MYDCARQKKKKTQEKVPTATNESKVHLFDPGPKAGPSRDKMISKVSVSCHFPPSHPSSFPPPQSVYSAPLSPPLYQRASCRVGWGWRMEQTHLPSRRALIRQRPDGNVHRHHGTDFKCLSAVDSGSLPLLYIAPHKSVKWLIRTLKWGFKIPHIAGWVVGRAVLFLSVLQQKNSQFYPVLVCLQLSGSINIMFYSLKCWSWTAVPLSSNVNSTCGPYL